MKETPMPSTSTKEELMRQYLDETSAGTLPLFRNGAVLPDETPLYSMAGVTTADFQQWKAIRGYVETEDEGSVTE